jgi:hypothetical protein
MMMQPIVHIVFAISGGGLLRQALRKAGRDEKVAEIWPDLNVGPLDPSDPAARAKWLEKEIGRVEPEASSERIWNETRFPDHRNVAWFTRRSAIEYAGFLGWLWQRGEAPCDIVDLTDVEIKYPPRTDPPEPWTLPSLALLHPDIIHRNKLWDLARPLPMSERLKHRELWAQCLAENAPLRVIEDGKLVSAPISNFDSLLIYHIGGKWQSISNLFSSVTNFHGDDGLWQTDDEFLAARIRALVESGQLEIRGDTVRSFTLGQVRRTPEP